jgi:hypothetical protein
MPDPDPARGTRDAWQDLAASLADLRELVDLFVERRAERLWRLANGAVTAVETSLSEGAACRWRDGRLTSCDGLERPHLAGLLGLATRRLPSVPLPEPGDLPTLPDLGLPPDPGLTGVRWLWRAAGVAGAGVGVPIFRPVLLDLTWDDGRRSVRPWPLDHAWQPPAHAPTRVGPVSPGPLRALLSPQAAATLLHELLGHPLEGDLLLAGASPWRGRQGERILSLPLDLLDDPTRGDLPGAFGADDEGQPGAARLLVQEGVLTGALATSAFAAALGVEPGNARRATLHTLPRPRVSNLVVRCPGALAEPPRGEAEVEIEAISSGTLEPRAGLVVLQVRIAHTLRHGRRVRGLAPFTLLGRLPDVAGGLLAAAEPGRRSAEPGWCGKEGEVVPTGSAAPWLLVEGLEAR